MKTLSLIAFILFFTADLNAQHNHEMRRKLNAQEVNVEHSLYHLDAEWTDHRGENITLSNFKGAPVIVVMFYGNCTEVCPILIQDAWRLYSAVDNAKRKDISVLAVSFDTENDTPEVLADYAEYEQLDIPGWHFMTSDDANIRSLAMMLGVQYSKKSDGHFAHSNLVTVLDSQGRIATRIEGLNQPVKEAAVLIESAIKNRGK